MSGSSPFAAYFAIMPPAPARNAPLIDAAGREHAAAPADARIVCLVPSITELLCDLGLAAQLVGRTGFCIHPRDTVRRIPKLGGTKGIDIDKTRALRPTHAIVNIEENTKEDATALAEFIPNLVVTYPRAPRDNLALYRLIGGIFGRIDEAETLCAQFEKGLTVLERQAALRPRRNVLYLIWKDPWMTLSRDTYISRMLALIGWDTLPADAAERWPVVDFSDESALAGVDLVLLSSEPFRFQAEHAEALRGRLPARVAIELIDGEMTSWYGSRAIEALDYLGRLRAAMVKHD